MRFGGGAKTNTRGACAPQTNAKILEGRGIRGQRSEAEGSRRGFLTLFTSFPSVLRPGTVRLILRKDSTEGSEGNEVEENQNAEKLKH